MNRTKCRTFVCVTAKRSTSRVAAKRSTLWVTAKRSTVRWALAAGLALTVGSAANWAQGQKTGGNNCDVPPEEARKHGCYGGAGSGHGHAHHSHHSGGRASGAANLHTADQHEPAQHPH
jgi:hypothetical protein